MQENYQLFRRTTPDWVKMLFGTVCALVVIALNGPPQVRHGLSYVFVTPIQKIVYLGKTFISDKFVHSYRVGELVEQNNTLKSENAHIHMQLQLMTKESAEVQALRAQIGLKNTVAYTMLNTQVLYQVVDPYMRKLLLAAGSDQGVQLGQPVISAQGLVGQITEVQGSSSEVTLVTDTKINVPVKNQRNPSVRGFVSGSKNEGYLEFRIFEQERTDLQVNDVLVTSALDGLYPAELPVARISNISPPGPDGRSETTIEPMIQIANLRYVAVVQVPNLAEMKRRSDAQADSARGNPVPTTLGARTREQFTRN